MQLEQLHINDLIELAETGKTDCMILNEQKHIWKPVTIELDNTAAKKFRDCLDTLNSKR